MRAPPPVEYASALTPSWRGALSLLAGATCASLLAWVLPYVAAHGEEGLAGAFADPVVQGLVALTMGGAAAFVFWARWKSGPTSERTLRWDGQDWVLVHPAAAHPDRRGDATLMLDLGPWMLVRFLPAAGLGPATWLPLSIGADLARWAALRGALWNWRGDRGDARP